MNKNTSASWINQVEELVLAGGGVKLLSVCGMWMVLQQLMPSFGTQIKRISGSSAGAFFGLMVTLNYRSDEMWTLVQHLPVDQLCLKHINWSSLFSHMGLFNKNTLEHWVSVLFQQKSISPECTFVELFEKTGRLLTVTVTVVNTETVEYHNALLTPHFPVLRSVVASMSIPVVFQPTVVQGDPNQTKYYWVDGGLLENVPLRFCDISKTLVVYFVRDVSLQVNGIQNYLSRLMFMCSNALQCSQLHTIPAQWKYRVLGLYTGHQSAFPVTTLWNAENKRRLFWQMVLSGILQTVLYLLLSM